MGSKSNFSYDAYDSKKTLTQGLFNIALLTADASQLKRVIVAGKRCPFYEAMLILIGCSIFFQILLGAFCVYLGFNNIEDSKAQRTLEIMNNIVLCLTFIIIVINIILHAFGFADF